MPSVPNRARSNKPPAQQPATDALPSNHHAERRAPYQALPERPAPAKGLSRGCVFCKPIALPNGAYNHDNYNGFIPTDLIQAYGQSTLLGGHSLGGEGALPLQVIGGDPLPAALGALTLTGLGVSSESAALRIGAGLVASNVVGVLALLWPSSLGDSALYSDEQLRSLETARTRVRLQVELQPDGTLKGYGFNTQTRRTGNRCQWCNSSRKVSSKSPTSAMASHLSGLWQSIPAAPQQYRLCKEPPTHPLSGYSRRPSRRIGSSSTRFIRRSIGISYWCFQRMLGFGRCMLCSAQTQMATIFHLQQRYRHFHWLFARKRKPMFKEVEKNACAGKTKRERFMSGIRSMVLWKFMTSKETT